MNLKKVISSVLVVLLFLFLLWKIIDDFDQIKSVQWKFQPGNLVLLLLALLPGPFVNALSWHLMTKALGEDIAFKDNFRIWTYSNATRFLPGSIWQYAGRVYMLSQKGVSKTFTTTVLLVESVFNLAVGSLVVLLVLNFWSLNIPPFVQNLLVPFLLLALFVMLFLTGNRIVFLQTAIRGITKNDFVKISKIRVKWLPLILISVLTQFVLAGLSLFLISSSIINISLNGAIFFVGVYAATWIIGYITFLAPSGLGVRETSIAGLLTLYMPISFGGVIAILLRILQTISEAITVLIVFLLSPKRSS